MFILSSNSFAAFISELGCEIEGFRIRRSIGYIGTRFEYSEDGDQNQNVTA